MKILSLNEAEQFLVAGEVDVVREAERRLARACDLVRRWALKRNGLPERTPVKFRRDADGRIVGIDAGIAGTPAPLP